jgi:hypothetical protein
MFHGFWVSLPCYEDEEKSMRRDKTTAGNNFFAYNYISSSEAVEHLQKS